MTHDLHPSSLQSFNEVLLLMYDESQKMQLKYEELQVKYEELQVEYKELQDWYLGRINPTPLRYRTLDVGDVTQKGDEFYHNDAWYLVPWWGNIVGPAAKYRRELELK